MKKIYVLLLMLGLFALPSITTQAFDIPLNYGVSDNDEPFVQTKNLFDKDTVTQNQFIRDTGVIANDNNWIISDHIEVLSNTSYTYQGLTSVGAAPYSVYYDNTFNFISSFKQAIGSNTITTPSNAKYIRFSIQQAAGDNLTFQLELGSTATSYAPYGFLSLNDIFLDGNKIDNNNWIGNTNTDISINNSEITGIGNGTGSELRISQGISILATNSVYINYNYKTNVLGATVYQGRYVLGGIVSFFSTSTYDFFQYENGSNKYTAAANITRLDFIVQKTAPSISEFIMLNNIYLIDLNTLGIDKLTINQLDALYYDFQINNIYNQGFTDGEASTEAYANGFDAGYETGYNTGYSDAVEEDNAYALGYALGLSQGEDMETGSSILIFVVAAIGFIMMIFGFTTKRGIFNLLSVGAFIVLGAMLAEFLGFIIITIGLVIINVYYAFWGDI